VRRSVHTLAHNRSRFAVDARIATQPARTFADATRALLRQQLPKRPLDVLPGRPNGEALTSQRTPDQAPSESQAGPRTRPFACGFTVPAFTVRLNPSAVHPDKIFRDGQTKAETADEARRFIRPEAPEKIRRRVEWNAAIPPKAGRPCDCTMVSFR
jgi:hypothetical protein